MVNYLITGITGFFGRNFTRYLLDNDATCTIVGTAHSEHKLALFKSIYPNIKIPLMDFSSTNIENEINDLIRDNNINYIIHSAAMKHVDICQNNSSLAFKVNVMATDAIIRAAKRNNVTNLIALSTDKVNDPHNTYGLVKKIMQDNVLANGYSVYQGANFFGSDGSVLDLWYHQCMKQRPLVVRNVNHIRYFNTIDHVCQRIYENINKKASIILPEHVYVIKLQHLLDAFCKYNYYDNVKYVPHLDYEKEIEILHTDLPKIELFCDQIIPLIRDFHSVTI